MSNLVSTQIVRTLLVSVILGVANAASAQSAPTVIIDINHKGAAALSQLKTHSDVVWAVEFGTEMLLGVEPETALAAFALGMAIDLSVSKGGEDVDYAVVDWDNWQHFSKGENYSAFMQQSGISVDAQRRFAPLEGTFFFALRSDNWVDDITVNIDIEAVVETPIFETQLYLEPEGP